MKHYKPQWIFMLILIGSIAIFSSPLLAQDYTQDKEKVIQKSEHYSPYVDQHFPDRVLFGDTHHHTGLSVDCGLIGNNNGPETSFRLARGEEVISTSGQRVKLIRPLDFRPMTRSKDLTMSVRDWSLQTTSCRTISKPPGRSPIKRFVPGPAQRRFI